MVDRQSKNFLLNTVLKLEKYGAIQFYSKTSGADNDRITKKENPRRPLLS